MQPLIISCLFFFFNDTATTEIYTLSLHDALPISGGAGSRRGTPSGLRPRPRSRRAFALPSAGRHRIPGRARAGRASGRSEEHTSELQSQSNLVCRLLLEKKKLTVQPIV